MEVGTPGLIRPHGYLVQRVGAFLVLHCADGCGMGGWGNRTHRPLGCKQNKQPGGVPMILSVASALVRGKCTSGRSQPSCRSGPKETPNGRRGCLRYTTAS